MTFSVYYWKHEDVYFLFAIVIVTIARLMHKNSDHGFEFIFFVDAWVVLQPGSANTAFARLRVIDSLVKEKNSSNNRIKCFYHHYRDHHHNFKSMKKDEYSDSIRNDCEVLTHSNHIHQCLCSPAPESYQVIQGAVERLNHYHNQNYRNHQINHDKFNNNQSCISPAYQNGDENGDGIKKKLISDICSLSYLVKQNHHILLKFNPQKHDSSIKKKKIHSYTWFVVESNQYFDDNADNQSFFCNCSTHQSNICKNHNNNNILELSRLALNIAINKTNESIDNDKADVTLTQINEIAHQAKERLMVTQGTDLRGRLSADAAFNFAMAGVSGTIGISLLSSLLQVACDELKRSGYRKSFKANNIYHMMDKFASTGILDFYSFPSNNDTASYRDKFISHATAALQSKGQKILFNDTSDSYFFRENSLLWLWRFSTRQPKSNILQQTQTQSLPVFPLFKELFDDLTKPLVVDVGCGMGISMLGLSSLQRPTDNIMNDGTLWACDEEDGSDVFWKSNNFNFLGIDSNPLFTRFAKGVCSRLNIGTAGNVNFVACDALDFLEYIRTDYPGSVRMIMIQFPTPYRLKSSPSTAADHTSNLQLPDSHDGFMVTPQLIDITYRVLTKSLSDKKGYLLLQSNCEDVALKMRQMVLSHPSNNNNVQGIKSKLVDFAAEHTMTEKDIIPMSNKRTKEWLQLCHNERQQKQEAEEEKTQEVDTAMERAIGLGWSNGPILPLVGRTETEIHHMRNKSPIHRCLFSFSNDEIHKQ